MCNRETKGKRACCGDLQKRGNLQMPPIEENQGLYGKNTPVQHNEGLHLQGTRKRGRPVKIVNEEVRKDKGLWNH